MKSPRTLKQQYQNQNLQTAGSGKVKIGQEIITKLDDISIWLIKGKVKNISLSTNSLQTQNGVIGHYFIKVELPPELITNYKIKFSGKNEINGTAEIITNYRCLAQRMFDNLKSLLSNE